MHQHGQRVRPRPRQHPQQGTAGGHAGDGGGGIGGQQQLAHFLPDAFGGQPVDAVHMRGTGSETFGVDAVGGVAVPGEEAEETQDAQVILPDPLVRVADEAHMPRQRIRRAAKRIEHRAIGCGVKCVHGEIAPARVFLCRVGKGDNRVSSVGVHVAAEGRDLERLAVHDDGHGAVVDPGGHDAKTGLFAQFSDCFGPRVGGDVQIGGTGPDQCVAHAAADEPGLKSGIGQHGADTLGGRVLQPVGRDLHGFIRSASARRMRALAPQM